MLFFNPYFPAVLPPTVGCVNLTRSEANNSYEVNADHDKPPDFCLVLPEVEVKGGNPYTMSVELMNVYGKNGVNHGHPGVMYNVIDENNFDTMHLRFVTREKPTNLARFVRRLNNTIQWINVNKTNRRAILWIVIYPGDTDVKFYMK